MKSGGFKWIFHSERIGFILLLLKSSKIYVAALVQMQMKNIPNQFHINKVF